MESLGPGEHKVCVSSQSVLPDMGFHSKLDFTPPTILLGLLLSLGCGVSFFLVGFTILLSMVVQQRIVILEFLQEKMSTCPSTLPS